MISLGSTDTLKLLLTAVENKTPKRPNQAYLILQDPSTGLEDSFPLSSKESGKAKVELVCTTIPRPYTLPHIFADLQGSTRSVSQSEGTIKGIACFGFIRLVNSNRHPSLRPDNQSGPIRTFATSGEATSLRQACRDPPRLPLRSEESTHDHHTGLRRHGINDLPHSNWALGIARCQPQSPLRGALRCPSFSRGVHWLYSCSGGRLLPLLQGLEAVSDATSNWSPWSCGLDQRQSRVI